LPAPQPRGLCFITRPILCYALIHDDQTALSRINTVSLKILWGADDYEARSNILTGALSGNLDP
jgi:hypothetical protein